MKMQKWKHYDADQVKQTGQRHRRDGIGYYPPVRWGLDDGEPDGYAPPWAISAYELGYKAGKQEARS